MHLIFFSNNFVCFQDSYCPSGGLNSLSHQVCRPPDTGKSGLLRADDFQGNNNQIGLVLLFWVE